jgi:eukaryotic-like serine/threonine-protein kinase
MFAEGAIVGSYRVLRKLGKGGMGAVYACEHTLLGRKAALKVLLPALSADPDLVQRLFNEARAVTLIADPGIVQVFDFGHHTDGSAFIVMELLDGETVDQRLGRLGRFAPRDALRLLRQVCTSLSAAHAKGIVHRDIKPDNIFIVGDPVVPGGERTKLLDFGVAKLAHPAPGQDSTQSGQLMGTPVYMSPEQCRGAHAADHRSDVYSIGCVAMAMLTGHPPFEGDGMGDLIVAHICHAPPRAGARVPELPPVFDQVLQRCLAKSPDDRFQTMAELIQALDDAERALYAPIAGLSASVALRTPTLAMPAPEPPSSDTTLDTASGETSSVPRRRSRKTTRAVLAATAAGAALAVATTVVVAIRRDRAPENARIGAASAAGAPANPVGPQAMPPVPVQPDAPVTGAADPAPAAEPLTVDAGAESVVPAVDPAGQGVRRPSTRHKAAKDAHDLRKVDRRD